MDNEELTDDERTILAIYGGSENMSKLRALTHCEYRAIQMAKLREYLSWPNERADMVKQRLDDLSYYRSQERSCDDPDHDTIQRKYSEN